MSFARAGLLTITARLDPAKQANSGVRSQKTWRIFFRKGLSDDGLKKARLNLEDSMDRAGENPQRPHSLEGHGAV